MSIENISEGYPTLVITGSAEGDILPFEPQVQAQPIGVEVVGRTTHLADESDSGFDGADRPFYRGVRVKLSDLPVRHSR